MLAFLQKNPCPHVLHAEESLPPGLALYVPSGQPCERGFVLLFGQKKPGLQGPAQVGPVSFPMLPNFPAGHGVGWVEFTVQKYPRGQSRQVEGPGLYAKPEAYVPDGQGWRQP